MQKTRNSVIKFVNLSCKANIIRRSNGTVFVCLYPELKQGSLCFQFEEIENLLDQMKKLRDSN